MMHLTQLQFNRRTSPVMRLLCFDHLIFTSPATLDKKIMLTLGNFDLYEMAETMRNNHYYQKKGQVLVI